MRIVIIIILTLFAIVAGIMGIGVLGSFGLAPSIKNVLSAFAITGIFGLFIGILFAYFFGNFLKHKGKRVSPLFYLAISFFFLIVGALFPYLKIIWIFGYTFPSIWMLTVQKLILGF